MSQLLKMRLGTEIDVAIGRLMKPQRPQWKFEVGDKVFFLERTGGTGALGSAIRIAKIAAAPPRQDGVRGIWHLSIDRKLATHTGGDYIAPYTPEGYVRLLRAFVLRVLYDMQHQLDVGEQWYQHARGTFETLLLTIAGTPEKTRAHQSVSRRRVVGRTPRRRLRR